MQSRRPETLTTHLIRAGFADLSRSAALWQDPELVAVRDGRPEAAADSGPDGRGPDGASVELGPEPAALLRAIGHTADPDLALLQLVRLAASAGRRLRPLLLPEAGSVPDGEPDARARLLGVLGASTALGDELVRHPELLDVVEDLAPGTGVDPAEVRAELLRAVDADPHEKAPVAGTQAPGRPGTPAGVVHPGARPSSYTDSLRRAYRARLLRIAATDVTAPDPAAVLTAVAAALADLAAAALEAALAIARSELPDHGAGVRLAVIGMGKTGGRELNYVSDVDVVYVAEPEEGVEEGEALRVGARLATGLARVCSATSAEPPLWQVDAALRPEGKQGPLTRTLASHLAYYERWASTWEFQALLKSRPVAGDLALGQEYREAIEPFVWRAVTRENFVVDAQAMRRRVEDNVPAAEAERQIKLGAGGLRDVEFTVQLLQLVHGRTDESIRSRTTLDALSALAAGGYVGREHAVKMAECYRFLRVLEHRIQLFRLRRTHLLPTGDADLRRLARALGHTGAAELDKRWRAVRREVRTLHEALFYRPLLPATAQLSDDELSLAPEAAVARFAAIGYRDPAGALRHVTALTEGVSRRAAIQRQLLPVLLGWFAEGADPDAGLLAFRRLSEELGSTPWYLRLLRDSEAAAARLAQVLASSRYLSDALARSPESVQWLAETAGLEPRGVDRLANEADAILRRATETGQATVSLRALRRRELARTGVGEVLGLLDAVRAARAISDAADVVLAGGLRIAEFQARAERGLARGDEPARLLVVAMGRLGGQEMGYGSDADVMFVYEPASGATDRAAGDYALAVATHLRKLLSAMGPEPALPVDADLRPEGRSGPLVRSFASYAEYYERWSSPWEAQALLRARPLSGTLHRVAEAGDAGALAPADAVPAAPDDETGRFGPGAAGGLSLGERFTALVDPLRYPAGGLDPAVVREVRRIKARVESERLPRGAEPARHLKLGRGGLADVEWTVQLLQLQHAAAVPELRTTGSMAALAAAESAGLVDPVDAAALRDAWHLASRLRSAIVLWSGRTTGASVDLLPHDRAALTAIARLLGDLGSGAELEETYLRTSRRARTVVERLFYGAG
ncbi:bifunctional [glutamine synthetase] adenylyltransferase/[glutamine synthetase]-adenylyl-L-tyrosine phosphorylase [Antribacter gilvus]|uniref:bifunctional [glutamine synthetase] adenylyltransferase/[glutamine synthetase]-adenylyl-L-tyrosine phosphorylase n=1 Tax=Antribacter gilvus TaxID=2304675 RepID=UPI000F797C4C|nr:bifunctional [glutamine synthetase] adenylyltransferase/[glutamine synthetase]-adenylyl-L-tyrosine phosphorylase [Antribacter gilvus]